MIIWNRILSWLLRRFFNLLYTKFAWGYDTVSSIVSTGMWSSWVYSILPLVSGSRILEIGFGPGHLQVEMASLGFTTFGLDTSPQMCQQAAQRMKKSSLVPKLTQGNVECIPFPSSWFDQVVATFPSEYIFSPKAITEINRVLKEDGKSVVIIQAVITGQQILQQFASWLFHFTGQTYDADKIWRKNIKKPFLQAGFRTDFEQIILENSQVLILVAQKCSFTLQK